MKFLVHLSRRVVLYAGLLLPLSCGDSRPVMAALHERAPSVLLSGADGVNLDLDGLAGNVVVLCFWATTCSQCLAEVPVLNELAGESGVEVIGIALDRDPRQRVPAMIARARIGYPVVYGDQETFERFGGIAIPYTVILDEDLVVRRRLTGAVEREDLMAIVEAMRG